MTYRRFLYVRNEPIAPSFISQLIRLAKEEDRAIATFLQARQANS